MPGAASVWNILFLAIPLALSSIHLLNLIGFPDMHTDEGTYMDRIMRVLKGEGPKEPLHYDHPYFGQLTVASTLQVIGYPNSLHPIPGNISSMENLILFPRFLMGILFVIDTFLIYKIAERRYNRKVAFLASIMFAVAPITTTLTRVFLDNILLPFLLSSILFAIRSTKVNFLKPGDSIDSNPEKNTITILVSGIFLGLAIFTKIPASAFIPVVAFLVFTSSGRSLKTLGLWLIPVILIPAIWPIHSLTMGQFDLWLNGTLWQAGRTESPLSWGTLTALYRLDPLFVILGLGGVVYAAVRRDLFILLGTIPFLAFLYFVGYVKVYYFSLWTPILSIAFAVAIMGLIGKLSSKYRAYQRLLPYAIIASVGIFQLATTATLVGMNANDTYFKVVAFVSENVPDNSNNDGNKIAVIGSPIYLWIPKYAFDKDLNDYIHYNSKRGNETDSFLIVADRGFKNTFSGDDKGVSRNQLFYDNSRVIGLFDNSSQHQGRIEIRANYLNPALLPVGSLS